MRVIIDTNQKTFTYSDDTSELQLGLYSTQAFDLLSRIWLKVGWNQKYPYTFTWLGRPIIQLPDDLLRIQEVIYQIQPDVIIETGIAHGGSLVFYASILHVIGKGRVIGIDIEIRAHNRKAIEAHELFPLINLVEGSSVDPEIVEQVKLMVKPDEKVLVILDSNHSYDHVLKEIDAYYSLVTPESYIVVTDGIMQDVHDTPRGKLEWVRDNPTSAALEFVKSHPEFIIEQPPWLFNESELTTNVTHWPSAWLKRVR